MNLSTKNSASAPAQEGRAYDRRQWHRRTSRPVTVWLITWIVAFCAQRWIPQARWLLVHIATLGLLTNSILIWGQYFTDALLKLRPDAAERSRQLHRIWLLNAGILVVMVGMLLNSPGPVTAGATGIMLALCWYGYGLVRDLRRSVGARFSIVVTYYAIAAGFLVLGAFFGGLLAFPHSESWKLRLLLAHQACNILGFVGITMVGTLMTLWPTILRTRMIENQRRLSRYALDLLLLGSLVVLAGSLSGLQIIQIAGFAFYAAGIAVQGYTMALTARVKPPLTFPALSVAAGYLWLVGSTSAMAIVVLLSSPTVAAWRQLTIPVVAGGLIQILFGAMAYLMPTVMGGGPHQVRRSMAVISWAGGTRVGVTNAGLLFWIWAPGLGGRIGAWLTAASLTSFVPILITMAVRFVLDQSSTTTAPAAPPVPLGPQPVSRRALVGLAAGAGATAVLAGAGTYAALRGQSSAVEIRTIRIRGMRYSPETITVARGTRLRLNLINDDPMAHDLYVEGMGGTALIAPGAEATLSLGVVSSSHEGWCTVAGHKQMGMVLHLRVEDSAAGHSMASMPGTAAAGKVTLDLMGKKPGANFPLVDATLPSAQNGTIPFRLEAREAVVEIAPEFELNAMTYNGRYYGPVLTGTLGSTVAAHLSNHGTMGHSIDFHAGDVSPNAVMKTIQPGESLEYPFTLKRSGIWLYHCGTMPMSMHIASGMFGAVVVPPAGIARADREYVIVQSEGYLSTSGAGVDATKLSEGRPDCYLFNGHANQYVAHPLRARVGERVRFWVLAAGPSRGISFHVVGAQFDTVFKEGAYLLRPGNPEQGGAQALDLACAQGGFVEMVFTEPGTYTFVNHDMVAAETGARGLIEVTA